MVLERSDKIQFIPSCSDMRLEISETHLTVAMCMTWHNVMVMVVYKIRKGICLRCRV